MKAWKITGSRNLQLGRINEFDPFLFVDLSD